MVAYLPQYVLIYKNKTTKGWSMGGVWADCIGATIACFQVILDYFNNNKGLGFFAELNYGKLCLNFICLLCCLVFFFQHYILYWKNNQKIAENPDYIFEIACHISKKDQELYGQEIADKINKEVSAIASEDVIKHKTKFLGIEWNNPSSGKKINNINNFKKDITQAINKYTHGKLDNKNAKLNKQVANLHELFKEKNLSSAIMDQIDVVRRDSYYGSDRKMQIEQKNFYKLSLDTANNDFADWDASDVKVDTKDLRRLQSNEDTMATEH